MEKTVRQRRLISLKVWEDEYEIFKQMCRNLKTTPSAKINEYIRETGGLWNAGKCAGENN